jgi:transposase
MSRGGSGRDQIWVPARLTTPCHNQRQRIPESLHELLPQENDARKFASVVERLEFSAFLDDIDAVDGAPGRPASHPRMLLLAWLRATSRGIGSARAFERLASTELGFRWISGDLRVRRSTLTRFRVGHLAKLEDLFTALLTVLVDVGVVNVDFITVDGVRLRAWAGQGSLRRMASLEELREQAKLHVHAVIAAAADPLVSLRVKRAREQQAKDLLERTEDASAAVVLAALTFNAQKHARTLTASVG